MKIIGTDKDQVQVKGIIKGKLRGNKKFEIKHRQDGLVLKVWIEVPRSIMGRFEARLNFRVPYSMDIEVINSSGNFTIRNAKTILDLLATSGDIRGIGIELLGDSKFTSTSGNVSMDF